MNTMKQQTQQFLLLDGSSGISGDMAAGALIDLLQDDETVLRALAPFQQEGYEALIRHTDKNGVPCTDLSIRTDIAEGHAHHSVRQVKRTIARSGASKHAKDLAERIYDRIAEAEAKAHEMPVDIVHFHEVGSIPSIMNVIACAVCLDAMGIEEIIVPCLYEGSGTVQCAHGILAVPVPAVKNLLEGSGIPLERYEDIMGEILTPSGAAVAVTFLKGTELPKNYRVMRTGYGAGKRDTGLSGVLRAELIETESDYE